MTQHIGIVACSAEGAALCYRTICLEALPLMGEHNHPQITMHSIPMSEYMPHLERDDWAAVAELMRRKPEFTCAFARERLFYIKEAAHIERYVEGLRRAGLE